MSNFNSKIQIIIWILLVIIPIIFFLFAIAATVLFFTIIASRERVRARAIEIVRLPEDMEETPGFQPAVIDGGRPERPAAAFSVEASSVELPVMGRIAAGTPIEAIQTVSHNIAVPGAMLSSSGRHYALEVKGDSMIEAGINSGDVVVIKEQSTAENGDIVVALIEGEEATLKTFRRRGQTIALEAANPAFQTRLYQDHQVKVQGKLVGLIRSY